MRPFVLAWRRRGVSDVPVNALPAPPASLAGWNHPPRIASEPTILRSLVPIVRIGIRPLRSLPRPTDLSFYSAYESFHGLIFYLPIPQLLFHHP